MLGFSVKRKPKKDRHRLGEPGRKRIFEICAYLHAHAPQIHYAQVRPMRTIIDFPTWEKAKAHLDAGGEITADCSEMATCVFKWAGLEDPNGMGFDGYGWTGSMWAKLKHFASRAGAHVGALGLYGYSGDDHVVIVVEPSASDPMVFSHGSEDGPYWISLNAEDEYHVGQPFTFCSVAHLGK